MLALQTLWFLLIVGLVASFALLAGFDLGVGALLPFLGRSRADRDTLRAISGPYWDGNQVWLIVAAGALFAAFPPVYGTLFSAYYLPLIAALLALVVRAVSFGFDEGHDRRRWVWDTGLFLGSAAAPFLLGTVIGGVVYGMQLTLRGTAVQANASGAAAYALLIGTLSLAAFAMQGSAWAALKTSGPLRDRCARARRWMVVIVAGLAALSAAATAAQVPERLRNVLSRIPGLLAAIVFVGGLILAAAYTHRDHDRTAFMASGAALAALIVMAATAVFPALLPPRDPAGRALTLMNASASKLSLTVMLVIAAIGIPVVVAYTVMAYRLFAGKSAGSEGSGGYGTYGEPDA